MESGERLTALYQAQKDCAVEVTSMDLRQAAESTRHLVMDEGKWPAEPQSLSRLHITWMLDCIESEDVMGEKAHRWLGWAQAAAVMAGAGTLDDMKEINHKA